MFSCLGLHFLSIFWYTEKYAVVPMLFCILRTIFRKEKKMNEVLKEIVKNLKEIAEAIQSLIEQEKSPLFDIASENYPELLAAAKELSNA